MGQQDLSQYREDNRTNFEKATLKVKNFVKGGFSMFLRILFSIVLGVLTTIVFIFYKFSSSDIIGTRTFGEGFFNFLGALGSSAVLGFVILILFPIIFYFAITYTPAGIKFLLVKYGRMRAESPLVSIVFFTIIVAVFSVALFFVNNLYKEQAIFENKRLEIVEAEINDLLKIRKYSELYQSISDKLIWRVYIPLFSFVDTSRVKLMKNDKYFSLLNLMLDDLKIRNSLIMDKENYDFVYNQIIPTYENTIVKLDKNQQKGFDEIMKPLLEQLDLSRHKYLETLSKEINTMKDNGEYINDKLSDIYHNSAKKYETKLLVMSTSYKDYWDDQKKRLLKTNNQQLLTQDTQEEKEGIIGSSVNKVKGLLKK